ncbi:unnamed protein product [Oppiella nova]|uniref:Uncharacterized protein n=1 Tax=Oppiella nova TaxID=334625 RepID=A0A7R9QGU5_9ACAR|nr:unnamed protein product [Oppiella nova]CAG2165664.1 unnamed protein product [Oppiella nova]
MVFNKLFKEDNRNALVVLSLFVFVLSIYLMPIWPSLDLFYHNEDIDRDTAQIIESRGFKAENHRITTGDGYILTVTRIINPHVTDRSKLRPILLQHGYQCNANLWIINSMGELTDDGKWVEDNNDGPAQIIESRGFKAENHRITTGDGYILTVTRIINPHVTDRSKLRPILLQHGYQCNANLWIINSMGELTDDGKWVEDNNDGPVGNTLGFVLAVNGYDVWLANMRGNMYSLHHTRYRSYDPIFWRFSIDEMIDYDLPAMISYIQKETQKEQLSYIGHSQGTIMMFGLLASQPHYSNIIKPFIAMSPVPFMGNSTSPLVQYGSYILSFLRTTETPFLLLGRAQKHIAHLCDTSYIARVICYRVMYSCLGYQEEQFNFTRTGVYVANLPAGSSSWNAAHLLQMVYSNRPQRYDYGNNETNTMKYQSHEPPVYDMSAINSTNIALIYSANDWLNPVPDVEYLKSHLNVKLLDDYEVPDPTWNHMELLWALETGQFVNPRIPDIFTKKYIDVE